TGDTPASESSSTLLTHPDRDGIQVTSAGNRIMITATIAVVTNAIHTVRRKTGPDGTPVAPDTANTDRPTGGEIVPTVHSIEMKTPNHSRSMSVSAITGRRIGTVMRITAAPSRNMKRTKNTAARTSSRIIG